MRGERRLLRAGEFLIRLAARRLPAGERDERHSEWTAELPVILHDPEVRPAVRRAARMLGYATDTIRGTTLSRGPSHRRKLSRGTIALIIVLAVLGLAPPLPWGRQNSVTYWIVGSACSLALMMIYLTMWWRASERFWKPVIPLQLGALIFDGANLLLAEAHREGWSAGGLRAAEDIQLVTSIIPVITLTVLILVMIRHRRRRRAARPRSGGMSSGQGHPTG